MFSWGMEREQQLTWIKDFRLKDMHVQINVQRYWLHVPDDDNQSKPQ